MKCIDFRKLIESDSLEPIFPGWKKGESVAFLSPHDDDVILGAGYLLLATIEYGGNPNVFVFSRGDAGYSAPEEKASIVERRREEAVQAYSRLGVKEENIHFFGLTDFSLMPYVNRHPPKGEGIFEKLVEMFRRWKVSMVVFSSGNFENWDHTAVFNIGMYVVPQAGDAVLVDLGEPCPVKTSLIYSVWGDFEPRSSEEQGIRADFGLLAGEEQEGKVMEGIRIFSSQRAIIENIVSQRKRRKTESGYLELYRDAGLRRPVEYKHYFELIRKCTEE